MFSLWKVLRERGLTDHPYHIHLYLLQARLDNVVIVSDFETVMATGMQMAIGKEAETGMG
jgi:hypothetical protein